MRALHTHNGHRNPGEDVEMPDGHMHFPTRWHPLVVSKSSYTYEFECDEHKSLEPFVLLFCALLDIEIDSLQFEMDTGGRR